MISSHGGQSTGVLRPPITQFYTYTCLQVGLYVGILKVYDLIEKLSSEPLFSDQAMTSHISWALVVTTLADYQSIGVLLDISLPLRSSVHPD